MKDTHAVARYNRYYGRHYSLVPSVCPNCAIEKQLVQSANCFFRR